MLTCAFGGRELIMSAYADAIRRGYRLYRWGILSVFAQGSWLVWGSRLDINAVRLGGSTLSPEVSRYY